MTTLPEFTKEDFVEWLKTHPLPDPEVSTHWNHSSFLDEKSVKDLIQFNDNYSQPGEKISCALGALYTLSHPTPVVKPLSLFQRIKRNIEERLPIILWKRDEKDEWLDHLFLDD